MDSLPKGIGDREVFPTRIVFILLSDMDSLPKGIGDRDDAPSTITQ